MQMNLRVVLKEVHDRLTLVSRKVISDHMDFFASGLMGDDIGEESDEFGRGVSCGGLTEHLTSFGVESRIEREGAMSVVLEAMTFRSARGKRQHGILAVQGLNRGLLIDTKHRSMLRRVQVQSDDVGRLGFKIRIVRGDIAFEAVRSERMLSPHTRDHHVGHIQLRTQFSGAPTRRSITGFALHTHSNMRASKAGVSVVGTCPA